MQAGAKALAFHTGTVAGNDDVLEAAFRRVGILRCDTIEELFEMAEVLGKQPRPKGCRLVVVTNAAGPAVLATDMLVKEGGEIAVLSDQSYQKLSFSPEPGAKAPLSPCSTMRALIDL
jgi:acetyltransferase